MADCNDLFKKFNEAISLNDSRKTSLRNSRTSIRNRIRKFFKENKPDEILPKFYSQGSFVMGTSVNPIPQKKDKDYIYKYDIDDGIYFIGEQARKNRKSISTYHDWIVEATSGHTDSEPIDKNTCVRIIFTDGHNIDLPIYYKYDKIPDLAHKSKGWIESDPLEFINWYKNLNEKNKQLTSIVKYLKAWKDNINNKNNTKMPSGLIMSILAGNHASFNDRDDIALKNTLSSIHYNLNHNFSCYRTTTPTDEDLLSNYNNRKFFMEELKSFLEDSERAITEKDKKISCDLWQKHFGERFSCAEIKDIKKASQSENYAPLITTIGSSTPWIN